MATADKHRARSRRSYRNNEYMYQNFIRGAYNKNNERHMKSKLQNVLDAAVPILKRNKTPDGD